MFPRGSLARRMEMLHKRTKSFLAVFLVTVLAGCASGISQQSLAKVTYTGSFSELQKNPNQFIDQIVLFGGKILEVNIAPTSSELIVMQMPLNNSNRPQNSDQSKGRFIIRSQQFLDPALYQKGSLLSAVAIIKGSQTRAIGGFNYVYPLLEAIEIKLWQGDDWGRPRIHFGIGIGTSF